MHLTEKERDVAMRSEAQEGTVNSNAGKQEGTFDQIPANGEA